MQVTTAPEAATADLKSLIAGFLERIPVMTLATASENRPWTATVNYAVDADLNLHFVSNRASRHVQELRGNARVAGSLYDPACGPGRARGLQFEGRAESTQASALPHALSTYARRFPNALPPLSDPLQFLAQATQARLYRVVPDRIWYLDEERFGSHGRREWNQSRP